MCGAEGEYGEDGSEKQRGGGYGADGSEKQRVVWRRWGVEQRGVWSRGECGADGDVAQMGMWRRWGCGAEGSVEQMVVRSRG